MITTTDNKGCSKKKLPRIEEQISNLIYDRCYPIILPEVSFLTIEDKHLIKVCIYRGSMLYLLS